MLLAAVLLLSVLLTGCIGASGDVSREGVDHSEVTLVVPLDRPFSFVAPPNHVAVAGGPVRAQVVSVHDGNTITVVIDGRTEKARLIGVDAPELDQEPWGVQSRDALRALVDGRMVRLETDVTKRDQYKRILAYVYVGDMFVNVELIRVGHAVMYTVPPNVAHVDDYRKAQSEAREAGRGLWNPAQPLDVMPDCYRKLKKGWEC